MTAHLTDEQRSYLTDHMWAVLATGRMDGSPQVSMIGYVLDAEDRMVISIKSYTAKWKNALRQPRVAIMVPTAAPTRPSTARPSASTPIPCALSSRPTCS
ncbi:MAG TPA: pyridoxamine 5'-phosphate oxidase family protein, partial [Acidimicrobiales bacterium]|nr:pyridoxamine 5'-phosphate oxidase family protein [Acidimicrobiales bacterium]